MSAVPEVSVVMGVCNGGPTLAETLSSVLGQQGVTFEFIVVDDGSSDGTAALLDDFAARDPRLRVLHQANAGLTASLRTGCALARGTFIARQDAGDVSLPGRLAAQCAFLHAHREAVMTCSAVAFVGPDDEPLYRVASPMSVLDDGLRQTTPAALRGPPHHGATLFRRDAYVRAGGYRAEFRVAQDIDLWLRLIELGSCLGTDEVHYRARLAAGSISSRRRDEQVRMLALGLACAQARANGESEQPLFSAAAREPRPPAASVTARERARFHYFVGSCLRAADPGRARSYFRKTLRDDPLHLRAWVQWMISR
jgi:glycosyltransferase involved in cell wall biosynthesis